MSSYTLILTRSISMGFAGGICGLYAVLVLLQGRPDPMPGWIPGLAGIAAAVAIWISVGASNKKAVGATFDEGYRADDALAQRLGFWVAVWLYPVFAIPLFLEWITWPSAFAAMGTLTAASYLLGSVWLDLRWRKWG